MGKFRPWRCFSAIINKRKRAIHVFGIILCMDQKKTVEPVIYLILIIALLAPRLPALNSFSTLDEPYWLSMGANFYYALGQGEFHNTVYEYQPAVTTMWIVTLAMLAYFPEYRGLGQGYLDYNKGWLDPFLIEHGKHPLVLLEISRAIQVIVILGLFLILFALLRKFFPKPVAVFAILFASFDPFFLSQSRLLDHEAMLSLFVLISVSALMLYLFYRRSFFLLFLSGVSAGLAQLTKSSAIAILLPVGVLFLMYFFQERQVGFSKIVFNGLKTFCLWLIFLALAYVFFWPGMWVAPKKMLYEVYGNAFSYAFQGARLSAMGELNSSRFRLDLDFSGILSLIDTLLRRTTIVTWLGILFGFILLFFQHPGYDRLRRKFFVLLWATAISFVLIFGVAQGRNSPHYILGAYLALNLLSGLGWYYTIEWFVIRFAQGYQAWKYPLFFILLTMQLYGALLNYPYYFTYQNPFLSHYGASLNFPLFPYGEGLELAAKYLANQPDAEHSTALVYYSRGCFSYFYPGNTIAFRPYYVDGMHTGELLDAVQDSDYLVVYYAAQGQFPKYGDFLNILSTVKPFHEIWLHGYKYVVIYQVDQFSNAVMDSLATLQSQP